MSILDIETLTANLTKAKARWQPRQNLQANFSDEEKRALLGVILNESALAAAMAPRAGAPAAPNFAPAVDWRNHNGNHVTAVEESRRELCRSTSGRGMARPSCERDGSGDGW